MNDTAHGYGLGHSEDIIARALRWLAERPYIFTKCGIEWNESGVFKGGNLASQFIRLECEDSFRHPEVETIDLYQIHKPWPGFCTSKRSPGPSQVCAALRTWRQLPARRRGN